jgi:hypothetical protein
MWVLIDKDYFAKQVGSMIVVGAWKLLYIREKELNNTYYWIEEKETMQ